MAYGLLNGHMSDDVTWPPKVLEAVRSAILATAWLLVTQFCANVSTFSHICSSLYFSFDISS